MTLYVFASLPSKRFLLSLTIEVTVLRTGTIHFLNGEDCRPKQSTDDLVVRQMNYNTV